MKNILRSVDAWLFLESVDAVKIAGYYFDVFMFDRLIRLLLESEKLKVSLLNRLFRKRESIKSDNSG